jgi:arsenite methyltransferase
MTQSEPANYRLASTFCLLPPSRGEGTCEVVMSGLEYTGAAVQRLEKLYLTKDVVAQRSETIRQLALSKGEHALDIGCGPGYLSESIATIVGSDGAVVGIDISPDLIALCKRRSSPKWLSFAVGDATQVDRPDASFDVVVCTQVAEYIPDVDRAISETFRVLKPGGRTVFIATDWDAVVWHSENPDRMARVMKSWEAHCAHPRLPRSLTNRLTNAGFRFNGAGVFPILNLQWEDDAYSKRLSESIRDFVASKNDIPAKDLKDWQDEFPRISEAGRYFFSSSRFIFRASKPL